MYLQVLGLYPTMLGNTRGYRVYRAVLNWGMSWRPLALVYCTHVPGLLLGFQRTFLVHCVLVARLVWGRLHCMLVARLVLASFGAFGGGQSFPPVLCIVRWGLPLLVLEIIWRFRVLLHALAACRCCWQECCLPLSICFSHIRVFSKSLSRGQVLGAFRG